MAGGRAKRKSVPKGPLQRIHDRAANEEAKAPLVNAFASQHGDYVKNASYGSQTNRGGSAVARWTKGGLLTESQQAAILHCQHLWQQADRGQRLVANLDRTVFGCPGEGNPFFFEALHDLQRIKAGFPHEYWDIFERVCRWDEPAGTAGSRLANYSRSASEAARLVVCMVADMIAMRERLSYRCA